MTTPNPLLNLQIPLGFGFMNASWAGAASLEPGAARDQFVADLADAMAAGVRFFDTADIYAPTWDSMGHNEILLLEAVAAWDAPANQKAELLIATKGGITRSPGEVWGKSASYDYLMAAISASAERLGLAEIPIWQHHRLDPNLTLAEQLRNLNLVKQNAPIRHIAVSNYSKPQLLQALDAIGGPADGGIISVQNQLNPVYRQQMDVLEVCEEYGLAYLPWSPTKGIRPSDAGGTAYEMFAAVAENRGVSTFAVAQAWLRSLSPNIVPMPGVTRLASIVDSLEAVDLRLTPDELQALSDLPPTLPLDAELVSDQPKQA
jgi:aryl-alcohol dehydrogenase-like predicted oxidoreductase